MARLENRMWPAKVKISYNLYYGLDSGGNRYYGNASTEILSWLNETCGAKHKAWKVERFNTVGAFSTVIKFNNPKHATLFSLMYGEYSQ